MARFYPSGGTGGADVSVVTAMADDVAKGKVIVGPDGNPITGELELTGTAADSQVLTGQTYYNTDLHEKRTGAMANQGAWKSEGLAAGAEVAIPPGYHNGGGKVVAKDLASQTPGDATAAQIWTGKKAWVNGKQVTGTLATQGGSTTIPGTAAKTIVTPNKIVTGNIVIAGDPNLIPANIKKGVPIFGVMGTHEGYVTAPLYVFNNGAWNGLQITGATSTTTGATANVGKLSTSSTETTIWVNATSGIQNGESRGYRLNSTINLTSYNFLKFKLSNENTRLQDFRATGYFGISTNSNISSPTSLNAYYAIPVEPSKGGMYALNIANFNGSYFIYFFVKHNGSSTSGMPNMSYGNVLQIVLSNT